jgi:hypothetical protein
MIEYFRRFARHFRHHHQGTAIVAAMSVIFNQLSWLIITEDFITYIYAVFQNNQFEMRSVTSSPGRLYVSFTRRIHSDKMSLICG